MTVKASIDDETGIGKYPYTDNLGRHTEFCINFYY